MPIVQAKCTNCGAQLQVDNEKDAAICPFCQTPYIVEKAINNYNINNQISIKDSEVKIYNNGLSLDEKYENANTFLTVHKDYERAIELFEELVKNNPNDYKGWWGVVRTKTKEFSFYEFSKEEIEKLEIYASSSFKVCDDNLRLNLTSKWTSYKNTYDNIISLKDQKTSLTEEVKKYSDDAEEGGGFLLLGIILFSGGIALTISSLKMENKNGAIYGIVIGIFLLVIGMVTFCATIKARSKDKHKLEESEKKLEEVESKLKQLEQNTPDTD